jgi:PPOX class probable F420-dependent enzyme
MTPPPPVSDPAETAFLRDHRYAVLATTKRDGSPQQSMVAYTVDEAGRIIISVKTYTAKWHNARRRPNVSLTIPDGRAHLVINGPAEAIDQDPARAELTAAVFGLLADSEPPDPGSIVELLDQQRRSILRVTPTRTLFHT